MDQTLGVIILILSFVLYFLFCSGKMWFGTREGIRSAKLGDWFICFFISAILVMLVKLLIVKILGAIFSLIIGVIKIILIVILLIVLAVAIYVAYSSIKQIIDRSKNGESIKDSLIKDSKLNSVYETESVKNEKDTIKKCSNCGFEFTEGIFCPECGAKNDIEKAHNDIDSQESLNFFKSLSVKQLLIYAIVSVLVVIGSMWLIKGVFGLGKNQSEVEITSEDVNNWSTSDTLTETTNNNEFISSNTSSDNSVNEEKSGQIVYDFTDDELCKLAEHYYYLKTGRVPPVVEVDHVNGDIVTIHLYENMVDHSSTWAWYDVSRTTGIGTDVMGEEVDLASVAYTFEPGDTEGIYADDGLPEMLYQIIVESSDGYVNVREEPTTSSTVLYEVMNGCTFNVIAEHGDWLEIILFNEDGYYSAYVHKSQIIRLNKSPYDNYVIWGSDSGFFDESVLAGLTAWDCRIARNEIYARHGKIFKDPELDAYFYCYEWYEPVSENISNSDLNQWELANVKMISQYEKKMGYIQ